jgi:hypothetical protein
MDLYGNSGYKGISIKFDNISSLFSNNVRARKLKVTDSAVLNDVTITTGLTVLSGTSLISSKDTIIDGGFTIGGSAQKDMDNEDYREEFDPENRLSLFPDMTKITDGNIVAGDKSPGDRLIASYWSDLGNDVFDDWGYFYLYDVNSSKYYFPIINPQNLSDGVFTTQNFEVFGRIFTIKHGWSVQGIFKFEITVNDDAPFQFGAYGDMGSDGDEVSNQLSQEYNLDGNSLTLYYHHHAEEGDSREVLYSYFVPSVILENTSQTYNIYYDYDEMHIRSAEVTKGLIVYFSKSNDVKDWVINDLQLSNSNGNVDIGGKLYVGGSILSKGYNIGRMTIKTMSDDNYTANAPTLINGYFKSNELTANRIFIIPTAQSIIESIPDCAVNTSFRFTINNVQAGNYSRIINTVDESVLIDSSCYNTNLNQNMIVSYILVITNINPESESAVLLQENSINEIFT